MKTKVKIISTSSDPYRGMKVGDEGYIDGYVRGGDDRAYAAVVVGINIDLVPLWCLEVIK